MAIKQHGFRPLVVRLLFCVQSQSTWKEVRGGRRSYEILENH